MFYSVFLQWSVFMAEIKNTSLIGITAAELMEKIEETYKDKDAPEISEVMILVIVKDDGDEHSEDDYGWAAVEWRASDPIWAHQIGLLESALEVMRYQRHSPAMEIDDEEEGNDDD